jgi:transposase
MRRASKPEERGFDPLDRRRLQRALARASDVRSYRRMQAVLLVAEGWKVAEAARLCGAKAWALYGWLRRFLEDHNPQALEDAPRAGRPPTTGCVSDEALLEEFGRDPAKLGYNTSGWTVALLAEQLGKRYGCSISVRSLRRRMHKLGLRWKRPRYVFTAKEPHRAQKKGRLSAA